MDPLSLAGAVVGLFSLGIQLVNWANTYIDSVQGRQEDIESVKRHLRSMVEVLHLIRTTTTSVKFSRRGSGRSTRWRSIDIERIKDEGENGEDDAEIAVWTCVEACKAEIEGLEKLLVELEDGDGRHERKEYRSSGKGSFRRKWSDKTRRWTYPYKRENFLRLEGRLGSVNGVLQTALATINLQLGTQTAGDVHAQYEMLSHQTEKLSGIERILLDLQQRSILYPHVDEITRENSRYSEKGGKHANLIADLKGETENNDDIVHELEKRLVSTPSQLKEACDAAGLTNLSIAPPNQQDYRIIPPVLKVPSCTCRPRRRFEKKGANLGFLRVQAETVESQNHFSGCPVASLTPQDSSKRTKTTYTTVLVALRHAISLSIAFTSGAGGSSLSPSIRTIRVADDAKSPAFRLLRGLSLGPSPTGIDITIPEVRESALEALCVLFKTGKASPFDVSKEGESLTEVLPFFRADEGIAYLLGMPDEELSGALEVISRITFWGVPSDVKSNFKRNPLSYVAGATLDGRLIPAMIRITELLYSLDYPLEQPVMQGRLLIVTGSFLSLISRCPQFSEDIWIGPLNHAIASRSKPKTLKILQMSRNCFAERNIYGHTPFHLATQFPDGLQLLLQAAQQRNALGEINTEDLAGLTPLQHAILASDRDHLEAFEQTGCRQNRCLRAQSIALLIKADCQFVADDLALLSGMTPCCDAIPHILIGLLTQRRARLKAIGLEFLQESDQARLGLLEPSILDAQVDAVIAKLEDDGIVVANSLRTTTPSRDRKGQSLYHLIQRAWLADLLFSAGFQDTHLPDPQGWTPIANFVKDGICESEDIEYLTWLLSHGATLESPALTFYELCRRLAFNLGALERDGEVEVPGELLQLALRDSHPDACRCTCSAEGCTTTTKLLNGYFWESREGVKSDVALPLTENWVVQRAMTIHQSVPEPRNFRRTLETCLRAYLFFVLGLRHTCCVREAGSDDSAHVASNNMIMEEEELEEIREEDGEGSQALESIISRFQQQFAPKNEEYGLERREIEKIEIGQFGSMAKWIQEAVSEWRSSHGSGVHLERGRETGVIWEADRDDGVFMNQKMKSNASGALGTKGVASWKTASTVQNETYEERVRRMKDTIESLVQSGGENLST